MAYSEQRAQYTFIFERIYDKASDIDKKAQLPLPVKPLLGFIGNKYQQSPKGTPFSLLDYLILVEETGKIIRAGKRSYLHEQALPPLHINSEDWLQLAQHFGKQYRQAVSSINELKAFAAQI
jgi:hypothetical protein